MKKRRSQGKRIRSALKHYRQAQAYIAIYRDNALCAFHYFLLNERRPMDDVHHVYGRARRVGDSREKYYSLLCTCRACHPSPIRNRSAKENLAYIEKVLKLANERPINPDFKHPNEEHKENSLGE